jgi:hypothetical protein
MTCKMYGAFTASLGVVVMVLAVNPSFGGSGVPHGASFASTHPGFHPAVARSLRHHHRNNFGAFWLGTGDLLDGPPRGEPNMEVTPPASGDLHYTYTYDVPWDAVHRFPPNVTPSARAYVPECTTQSVTVPHHGGSEQTANVNITRCY